MSGVLGLPDDIRACLFDLDGVLTQTATVHQAAWKRTFDEFLRNRDPGAAEFSADDYNRYVDGKPRKDGVRDFLTSRGITLPEGSDDDLADALTVAGVATRKNELIMAELDELRGWRTSLAPAGFRDGLGVGLLTTGGRHVGFLTLLTYRPAQALAVAAAMLHAANPLIADAVERVSAPGAADDA